MALDIGFVFGVTNFGSYPANTYLILSSDVYPTTKGGVVCGWEDTPTGFLDDSGASVTILKGIHYAQTACRFRVDLPNTMTAGIQIAAGYQGSSEPQSVIVRDTTTNLWTASGTTGAGQYMDANSTIHASAAAWNSSQAPKSATFTTTVARIVIGSAGVYTTLNYVRIVEDSSSAIAAISNYYSMMRS